MCDYDTIENMVKNASIQTILEIKPIQGADFIEVCRVLGWQTVIKKDQYRIGDKIIFVPIDTVLPLCEWSSFLQDKKDSSKPIIVKTCKMKNTISQGVIFPLNILPEASYEEGQDVSEILGIKHYESPLPQNTEAIGKFPTVYLSITDEDNMKNSLDAYNELKDCGFDIEVTLKIDGTSASYITPVDDNTMVCSRRLSLKDNDNVYWKIGRRYKLIDTFKGLAISGEIYGDGIQKNKLKITGNDLAVFNVKNLIENRIYNPQELTDFCVRENLKKVPTLKVFKSGELPDIDALQEYVNDLKYPNGTPAEGAVFRPRETLYSNSLQKELSLKLINQNYKD